MPTLPTRELKIGKIIDKTLAVLEANAVPALIFVTALTAVGLPITYFSVGSTAPLQVAGGQLLRTAIGVVIGYFMLVTMLRRTGLQARGSDDTFLPFVGLSILSSLAVMLGMIALIIPGLILIARWSIAQPLLVAQGTGVMASLGESWARTRGNEFSILAAVLALALLPIAVIIAVRVWFEQDQIVGMVVAEVATGAITVALMAMGVALYAMILGRDAETTFA
jgi:hypothetical protein